MRTRPRWKLDRRGDISSPIIVILVTVAALAVTGLAIAWMGSTMTNMSNNPSLIVVGTPTITAGSSTTNTLYIVVKNVGNAQATITSIRLGIHVSGTLSETINAGTSKAFTATFSSSTFTSGQTYQGVIISNAGTIQFSAICQ